MATRAIVTHQPEVACDVCGRRLLRGERPDTFVDGGDRRVVCELCIPRAVGAGWTRESEALAAAAAAAGDARGGRSLIGRFRQRRGAQRDGRAEDERFGEDSLERDEERRRSRWRARQPFELEDDAEHPLTNAYGGAGQRRRRQAAAFPLDEDEQPPADRENGARPPAGGAPYDTAGDSDAPGRDVEDENVDDEHDGAVDAAALGAGGPGAVGLDAGRPAAGEHEAAAPDAGGRAVSQASTCAEALASFNSSEAAVRIAGIARALGEPTVTVRALDEHGDRAAIVVAWELCWYRYEVDLLGERPVVVLAAEGMELHQLADEDRAGNAIVDDRGRVSL